MSAATTFRLLPLVLIAAALNAPLAAQESRPALTGRVIEAGTARPVAGARVLRIGGGEVRSAADGTFRLNRVEPGAHRIAVSAVGYDAVEVSVTVGAEGMAGVEFELPVQAVALRPVEAEAEARDRGPFAGFWERRERGRGHYFTREEIERRRPSRIADIIRTVPGARVIPIHAGQGITVTFSRNTRPLGDCPVTLYLDGRMLPSEFAMNELGPEEIEAVEVYQGAAQVPSGIVRPDRAGCGVVLLWSRRGEPAAPRTPPRGESGAPG
ncbi:MAG TPA: TonB-dependent receptor [Longimicrobiaceae bacterium]|nr:TonB-dependent receptor [Longimicrobiaceae bacterium]